MSKFNELYEQYVNILEQKDVEGADKDRESDIEEKPKSVDKVEREAMKKAEELGLDMDNEDDVKRYEAALSLAKEEDDMKAALKIIENM